MALLVALPSMLLPLIALALSSLSVVLAILGWRRARRAEARAVGAETLAIEADKRAQTAETRAIASEQRVEQAHTQLKKLQATAEERRDAELDAPMIADRWYTASRSVAAKPSSRAKADAVPVTFRLTGLAELLAVDRLRAHVGRGDIERVEQFSDRVIVYVHAPGGEGKPAKRRRK